MPRRSTPFLNRELAESAGSACRPPLAARWREAASILARQVEAVSAESNQLCMSRVCRRFRSSTARSFPFLAPLEAKTDVIRAELIAALEADRDRFTPVHPISAPEQPVNQWRELNHSLRWSTLHLWRSGKPVEENLERCPETARALAALPMADIGGLCPNAMFSALAPKTHIPPHNGETNARVVAHLPLIVPDGCWYRVGFEERRWQVGEMLSSTTRSSTKRATTATSCASC